jgi:hypothetical protein
LDLGPGRATLFHLKTPVKSAIMNVESCFCFAEFTHRHNEGAGRCGDPQKAAPALARLFGPKILRFAEAAWSSTDQSKRIALCDLAIHDRQIVADHYENRLVIGGRHGTRFYNAFKIKLPIEPTAIARVRRLDSSPKLPPIDIDFADIVLPPERR